jgi:Na+/H+ antiporter NhaD/arsenite permease-like protein
MKINCWVVKVPRATMCITMWLSLHINHWWVSFAAGLGYCICICTLIESLTNTLRNTWKTIFFLRVRCVF